jgi:hypothetical protein
MADLLGADFRLATPHKLYACDDFLLAHKADLFAHLTAWRLVEIETDKESPMFIYRLNRQKLRRVRRREGRYLLRTKLTENDPALLWQYYIQLVAVRSKT